MKTLIVLAFMFLSVNRLPVVESQSPNLNEERIVFSGEILEVGAPPGPIDKFPFQVIKYRVTAVCEGSYDKQEVLVYHMTPPEGLKDVKSGDKVCLGIYKSLVMEDALAWAQEDEKDKAKLTTQTPTDYLALDKVFIRRCQCSNP